MEQQTSGSLRLVMTGIALAVSLALGTTAVAQQQSGQPSSQRNEQGTSRAAARNHALAFNGRPAVRAVNRVVTFDEVGVGALADRAAAMTISGHSGDLG